MSSVSSGTQAAVVHTATGPPTSSARPNQSSTGWFVRLVRGFKVSSWKQVPFPLLLLALWALLRWSGVALPASGILGLVLIILSSFIIVLEFLKSGDIATPSFRRDLAFANLALIAATASMSLLWYRGTFYLTDLFIAFMVLVDSQVNTTNSFKMALRNLMAGVSHGHHGSEGSNPPDA